MENLREEFAKYRLNEWGKSKKLKLFSWMVKRLKKKNPKLFKQALNSVNSVEDQTPQFIIMLLKLANKIFGDELDCGHFRCVFPVDQDQVLKVGNAQHNQAEANNEMITKYPDLFPKPYERGEHFLWLVVERVYPLKSMNQFIALVKPMEIIKDWVEKYHLRGWAVSDLYRTFLRMASRIDRVNYDPEETKEIIMNFSEEMHPKLLGSRHDFEIEDIAKLFATCMSNMDDFTRKILRVVREYETSPVEIRYDNVGLTEDGKLVLLDASQGDYFN